MPWDERMRGLQNRQSDVHVRGASGTEAETRPPCLCQAPGRKRWVPMVEFFTAILVGALLHLLFGPFFDDALESLGEWRMGRAVARRERRQRRSTNDSVKPAARPGRRACSSYALTRVGSEGEGSNSFRTSPTSTRLPASGFHTKMDFRPLPRKVKAS